jgi:hypothetical protein
VSAANAANAKNVAFDAALDASIVVAVMNTSRKRVEATCPSEQDTSRVSGTLKPLTSQGV